MAPVRPSSSRTFARVTYSERPVGRRNLRLALEPLERIVDEYSKRGGADGTQRSLPEHGKQKSRPGRCFKPRRGRTERRIWPNPSAIRSRRSPRKIRGRRQPTDYRAIDGQGPLISSAEHAWYRVPPSQDVSPGLVIARFHDQTLEVNQTSVLDISRPFGDLLEHLQRQSEIVKAYFTGIVGGFTMDDGPWWYEILTRPSEGETISPEGQWELLGDVHDYGLLVKRVMLNPNIWSVVFRHHTQMLEYGLSERTQAIMRQRVSGKPQGDRQVVEDMITRANFSRFDETLTCVTGNVDTMDIS